MIKTTCDICGKDMANDYRRLPVYHYNFCISSYGTVWDVCNDCRSELNKWIEERKERWRTDEPDKQTD